MAELANHFFARLRGHRQDYSEAHKKKDFDWRIGFATRSASDEQDADARSGHTYFEIDCRSRRFLFLTANAYIMRNVRLQSSVYNPTKVETHIGRKRRAVSPHVSRRISTDLSEHNQTSGFPTGLDIDRPHKCVSPALTNH